MNSPYFLNNLALLLIILANFFSCVITISLFKKSFANRGFVFHTVARISLALYASAAVIGLLIAGSLFYNLELSNLSRGCWKTRQAWTQVEVGMTEQKVVSLLGKPTGIRPSPRSGKDDSRSSKFLSYCLHPFEYQDGVLLEAKSSSLENTVIDKFPTNSLLAERHWLPKRDTHLYKEYGQKISEQVKNFSLLGICFLALSALLPFGFNGNLDSWTFFSPFSVLIFAGLYEFSRPFGWRFDLFLIYPLYAVILIGWLCRIGFAAFNKFKVN